MCVLERTRTNELVEFFRETYKIVTFLCGPYAKGRRQGWQPITFIALITFIVLIAVYIDVAITYVHIFSQGCEGLEQRVLARQRTQKGGANWLCVQKRNSSCPCGREAYYRDAAARWLPCKRSMAFVYC